MQDTFYPRLDFYRMLHAGLTNLTEMALALGVSIRTLQRWKAAYDSCKGPYGSLEDVSVRERLGFPQDAIEAFGGQGDLAAINGLAIRRGSREEILWSLRRSALDGNVQAARLVLDEYSHSPSGDLSGGDALTVEQAVELLRKWHGKKNEITGKLPSTVIARGAAPKQSPNKP